MSDSGTSTPRSFISQAPISEDILKSETVGLIKLDELRKKRRNVEELKSSDIQSLRDGTSSTQTDIDGDGQDIGFKKKKRRTEKRGILSFEEDDNAEMTDRSLKHEKNKQTSIDKNIDGQVDVPKKRKFLPNPNTGLPTPKAMTKASMAVEAVERQRLQQEFLELQERVRSSDIAIPFVFYDGANIPGGMVKMKKGEHIWLFLERCRKLGAELGVSSTGSVEGGGTKVRAEGKKSWARIGVDDLMLVKNEIIIPHHHEFYYFIANQVSIPGNSQQLLFNYTASAPARNEDDELLTTPKNEKLEGQDDDPNSTKVVDRRWYEKNKHIYPASMWREYKTGKEFEDLSKGRRDAEGNAFFFS